MAKRAHAANEQTNAELRDAARRLLAASLSIRRTARRHRDRPRELSSLSDAQLELARVVRRQPGVSITAAASSLNLASNTVSTLVRELVDRGVVERRVAEEDRRMARLELTRPVRQKVEAWRDKRVVAFAGALQTLSASDRIALIQAAPALERLAQAFGEE